MVTVLIAVSLSVAAARVLPLVATVSLSGLARWPAGRGAARRGRTKRAVFLSLVRGPAHLGAASRPQHPFSLAVGMEPLTSPLPPGAQPADP